MLPGTDGLEICRRLRSQLAFTSILMLTSRSSELDRVVGLEMGADDYVTKPFSIRELMARVKAIFRRVEGMRSETETPESHIISVIEDEVVIKKILKHLGLWEVKARPLPKKESKVDETAIEYSESQLLEPVRRPSGGSNDYLYADPEPAYV